MLLSTQVRMIRSRVGPAGVVFEVMEDDLYGLTIKHQLWEDLERPDVLTVTIRPGDWLV